MHILPKGNAYKIRWVLIKSRAKHHSVAANLHLLNALNRS